MGLEDSLSPLNLCIDYRGGQAGLSLSKVWCRRGRSKPQHFSNQQSEPSYTRFVSSMAFLGLKRLLSLSAIHRPIPIRPARFFSANTEQRNALKQFMEDPQDYAPSAESLDPEPPCRSWNAEEAVHIKIHMPGLGKEDIKVLVENNCLIVHGKDPFHDTSYNLLFPLPEEVFKGCKPEARMVNGLLKVLVLKTTKGFT